MRESASKTQILIVYYSRFGVVRLLAEQIAAGANQVRDVEAALLEVEDRPVDEVRRGESRNGMARRRAVVINRLAAADALIVGAPSYFGSMASPVKRLFEDCATAELPPTTDRSRPWRHYLFRNKVGAAFTVSGTPHGGNEQTLHSILTMMMHLGMILVTPGQREPILEHEAAPYGATAISGAEGDSFPTESERAEARALGKQVAEVTIWMRRGRTEWEREREDRAWATAEHDISFDPSA